MNIQRETDHVFRMTIPYKDIFTTIYVIKTEQGTVMFDAASIDEDTPEYILPMLKELNVSPEELKYIFISHNHGDHAGGLNGLKSHVPNTCIVSRSSALQEKHPDMDFLMPEDGDILLDVLQVVTVPGHTQDSIALLDKRTNTMISGDCLQLYGIYGSGNWACNIGFVKDHLQAIEKVRAMNIQTVLTAHDYHPYGYRYDSETVGKALDACVETLMKIKDIILQNPDMTDERVAALYNAPATLPKLGVRPVASVRRDLL